MGDEHLNTISETENSSVENLVPIPSEFKGISKDIYDVPSCDNDHFDAEFGLINSLLSRDISITSSKIDFLLEEFVEDEILREKLLNINLLVDKIEALKLTPSIPFVLENPSSSPIPVVEEVDTFLVPEDSIPPGIESDFDSEGDIVFLATYLMMTLFLRGGEIDVSQNVKDGDSFAFVIRTFLPYHTYHVDSLLLFSTESEDTIFDPDIST
ncbi:hypothetical protein Tco_0760774 [Tanacetum coccineum]